MIRKLLKWLGLIILTGLTMLTVAAWIGSWVFLDQDARYSHNVAQLPDFAAAASVSSSEERAIELVLIPAGERTFRARISGFNNESPKGNLILLHGFPETSIMWQPLIEKAVVAGYRVVAFDQRGYSPGARPPKRDDYQANLLVTDVLNVADAVGFDTFNLVGHDWGAVIGWQTVFTAPERVESFSALSIPHISAIVASVQQAPELRDRSAYMAFYWLPWLPELSLSADNFSKLREFYEEHPAGNTKEYLELFSEPGALTGALNWYRGALQGLQQPSDKVSTPTLFIWGNQDPVTSRLAVELQADYMSGSYEVIELEAGHWIVETQSQAVVTAVMAHLNTTDS